MRMKEKLILAEQYSMMCHHGQVRKFTGEPYYEHPMRVSMLASEFNLPTVSVIVGWLHDTVEDTEATIEKIKQLFGVEVSSLVQELTSDKSEQNKMGNTQYLINKMKNMSNQAFTIKLLDRLDNVDNIINAPEKFAKKYYLETKEIITAVKPRSKDDIIIIERIEEAIKPVYDKYWL